MTGWRARCDRSTRRPARLTRSGIGRDSARPGRPCLPRPAARSCWQAPSPCRISSARAVERAVPHQPRLAPPRRRSPGAPAAPLAAARRLRRIPARRSSSTATYRPRRRGPASPAHFEPTSVTFVGSRRRQRRRRGHRPGRTAMLDEHLHVAGGHLRLWHHLVRRQRASGTGSGQQHGRQPASVRRPARRLGLRSGAVRDQRRRLAVAPGEDLRPARHRRRSGCRRSCARGVRAPAPAPGRITPRTAPASRCTRRWPAPEPGLQSRCRQAGCRPDRPRPPAWS